MLLALCAVLAGASLLAALAWGYKATATSVTVTVDGMTASVLTHQAAVSDLLSEMELKLAPEDHLVPAASTPLTPGLAIAIQRARPVLVHVDGRSHTVLTHATTVGAVLTEAGVTVGQHDPIRLGSAPATLETALPGVQLLAQPEPAKCPHCGKDVPPPKLKTRRRRLYAMTTAAGALLHLEIDP